MKKLVFFLLLIVLLLLVVIFRLGYKDYQTGTVEEREDLLVATTFDLSNNKGISLDEVKSIQVYKMSAGIYPFNYSVVVVLKDNREYYYEWKDKSKSELSITNQ